MIDYGGYIMKDYVVLHGQTDPDAEGRIIGNTDPHLNDKGREQAHDTAMELKGSGGGDPGRLLSQAEIDALIAELTGG